VSIFLQEEGAHWVVRILIPGVHAEKREHLSSVEHGLHLDGIQCGNPIKISVLLIFENSKTSWKVLVNQ
jgi:hypothetical protein